MARFETVSALRAYYSYLVRQRVRNDQGMLHPVEDVFSHHLEKLHLTGADRALDVGYGFGNYTIALANSGYLVDAVDLIDAGLFRQRLLGEQPDLSARVTLFEQDITEWVPRHPYRVVVAKDVLHFLDVATVESLLRLASVGARAPCLHYVSMFTNIQRIDASGKAHVLPGEAGLTSNGWRSFAADVYAGWTLTWHWEAISQRNSAGEVYFNASRGTLAAWKD